MYNHCEIFILENTKVLGRNLQDLFKYLHISTKLNTTIISNRFIDNLNQETCVFVLYNSKHLDKLKINNTFQVYFMLVDEVKNNVANNVTNNIHENKYNNIISTNKNNRYYIPILPLPDDEATHNIDNFFIIKVLAKICCRDVNFDNIHNFALFYGFHNIKKVLGVLKKNNKEKHRYICFHNINIISNIIIPEFGLDKTKETVLIEFREFPHVEFLLRNMIIKMPNDWNHTVVCGRKNYDSMCKICNNICQGLKSSIRVIKLFVENLDRDEYCRLLTSSFFWDMFTGEKILLYQEDTMLFHGNIDAFLCYDYVGAPWKRNQDDNSYHVGNGGFSLRSKSAMLKVIKENKQLILGNSTKNYMKNSKLNCIPEDVYFSKSLIDYSFGKVAPYDVALKFSQEAVLSNNSLGGHAFWLAEPNKKIYNIYKMHDSKYYLTVTHRGGWKSIITNLINKGIISNNSLNNIINHDIYFLDSVEKFFLWEKKKEVITSEWVGVIHIVPNTPHYMGNIKIENLLENYYFKESLNYCRGIIVLSKYLLKYLQDNMCGFKKIKYIKHPCVIDSKKKFDIGAFFKNIENLKIIQLGSQLRYITTIYKLQTNYEKLWLPGRRTNDKQTDLLFYWLNKESETFCIPLNNNEINKVKLYYTDNYNEYDHLLLHNIIIINLINASANNAVVELISLNTPFFINKLDAIVEYIGEDYPLYFNSISELEQIINNKKLLVKKIIKAYNYLSKLNKTDISLSHFNSEILEFIN